MKYEDIPRYCFNCGTRMNFTGTDEYGTHLWLCPHCKCYMGD